MGKAFVLRSQVDVPGHTNSRPSTSRHGVIIGVTPDALALEMDHSVVMPYVEVGRGPLSVPLELVAAAWRDPHHPMFVSLALSVPLVWDGMKWAFGR
jgi:hypothetical protein